LFVGKVAVSASQICLSRRRASTNIGGRVSFRVWLVASTLLPRLKTTKDAFDIFGVWFQAGFTLPARRSILRRSIHGERIPMSETVFTGIRWALDAAFHIGTGSPELAILASVA
jgi:hypothetical protein